MRKLLKCGARKRDRRANAMSTRKAGLSADHRHALSLLAGSSHGCTEAILLAHGFTIESLIALVRGGLATATPEIVHVGSRPIEVVRVGITDAGRRAFDRGTWRRAEPNAARRASPAQCRTPKR
jgi:hypothetical protein